MDAEQIVRALAEHEPSVHTGAEWHSCGLCEKSLPVSESDHRPDCLWRLAREWVAAQDG